METTKGLYVLTDGSEVFERRWMTEAEAEGARERAWENTAGNLFWEMWERGPRSREGGSMNLIKRIDAIAGDHPLPGDTWACDECGEDTALEASATVPAWVLCEECAAAKEDAHA